MKGRRPTSTAELKMRGSYRPDRHGNRPEIEPDIPSCPGWLDAQAKTEWKRLSKELFDRGILTILDRNILALHCQAVSDYLNANVIIKNEGTTVTGTKGGIYQHPAVGMANKAFQRIVKTAVELRLTPASRPRVGNTPKKSSDSDKSRYFDRLPKLMR